MEKSVPFLLPQSIHVYLPSVGNAFIRSALGNMGLLLNVLFVPKAERINAFPTDGHKIWKN